MLNADSFGGFTGELLSHNVFAYVQNNPVMLYDPSGYYAVGISGEDFGYGGLGFTKESADKYIGGQTAVLIPGKPGIKVGFQAISTGLKALWSGTKSLLGAFKSGFKTGWNKVFIKSKGKVKVGDQIGNFGKLVDNPNIQWTSSRQHALNRMKQ
jgi:hypothetical protein